MGDGSGEIVVDVHGLQAAAGKVRANGATLTPHAEAVAGDFGGGSVFGAKWPGETVKAAKDRYEAALQNAMDTLYDYREATEVLAGVVELIVDRYRHADAAGAVRSADVDKALSEAVAKVQAASLQQQGPSPQSPPVQAPQRLQP